MLILNVTLQIEKLSVVVNIFQFENMIFFMQLVLNTIVKLYLNNYSQCKWRLIKLFICWFKFVSAICISPYTAFSQAFSVDSLRWRIRDEQAGNLLTSSLGPRGPKPFGRGG